MNAVEAEAAIRMVAASWPTPQLTDDEAQAWARRFGGVSFDEAANALLDLERTMPRRPAWSDVWRLVVEARRRVADANEQQSLPAPTSSYAETGRAAIARLREEWGLQPRPTLRLQDDRRVQ